ncbi:uncharacterized protein LOC135073851 [Ostrinia nubilalis]|uniref:uncharacterized protein LOC135073851 n=1 Tax=Ostrinia nubilalis TaxID=29057 RepID=UPI0030822533
MAEDLATIVAMQTSILQTMQKQIEKLENISVPWPTPVNVEIDPEDAYKLFLRSWENYCRATQIQEWPKEKEPRKVGILFNAIGEEALKKYSNFGIIQTEKTTSAEVLNKMASVMVPRKNIIYNRYLFWSTNQHSESFDIYYSSLLQLIEECNYHDKDEMLRDKIVLGIKNNTIKKELLKKESLTLGEAVNLCRAAEATDSQMRNMSTLPNEIKAVKNKKKGKCRFCGTMHIFQKEICPAWGKVCQHCKGRNHLETVCKKKKQVKEVIEQEARDTSTGSESEISIINKIVENNNKNLAECEIEYKRKSRYGKQEWSTTTCLLDTAADECLIGRRNLEKMFGVDFAKKNLRPSNKTLFSFSGHNIMVLGETDILIRVRVSGKVAKYQVTFQVVHVDHIPLLSCKACTRMGLVKFCKEVSCIYSQQTQEIINKHINAFEGKGSFSGEVNLEVDHTIPPVIQKARRVPVALRPKLKEELLRLEQEGIITKEENHTDWRRSTGSSSIPGGMSSGICVAVPDPY